MSDQKNITPKPEGNVSHSYSESTARTYSRSTGYWISLSIINDSDEDDVTFTVNNITITVKPNEEFTDNFDAFNSIRINTNVAYRLILRE